MPNHPKRANLGKNQGAPVEAAGQEVLAAGAVVPAVGVAAEAGAVTLDLVEADHAQATLVRGRGHGQDPDQGPGLAQAPGLARDLDQDRDHGQ